MAASAKSKLGMAWLALVAALALHVTDEALTGFLSIYNPTVEEMRRRLPWWPMPVFTFEAWLSGLITAVLILFALSPFMFRGARWMRPLGYFLAGLNILNATAHTIATIFGRTVETVRFARPAPGFYSSPLLLATGVWMLILLRTTKSADESSK
jgi:hypothetical protein